MKTIHCQHQKHPASRLLSLLLLLLLGWASLAQAADYPVKDTDKYAYAENAGWVNFKPTGQGATLHANGASSFLTGYVWAENVGYIKLAYDNNAVAPFTNTTNSNWGVNADAAGNLSGYAWSKTAGWIKFDHSYTPATFNTATGALDGYAWSQNLGWIHFKNAAPAYNVSFALTATLTTTAISSITTTSAASGGTITDDGGAAVTARGVCWNTAGTPTIADATSSDGAGIGAFSSSLSSLLPNTVYYVRAYATTSNGTAYGNQISFTTSQNISAPTVTTSAVTGVGQTTASSGGTVTSDGNATVTARGVCWNTTGSPTTADSKTTDGTGTGAFTSAISGLTASTAYYARAYATNSQGTSYGAAESFTTSSSPPPPPPPAQNYDILWRNTRTGKNVVWLMDGATYLSNNFLPDAPLVWAIAGVADFDNDGNSDILWRHTGDGRNVTWYMNGATRREFAWLATVPLAWTVMGAADFDSDSKVDILWRNPSTWKNILWLMDGVTKRQNAWLPDVRAPWIAEGVGDMDGDGKVDILWRNHENNKFIIWLMSGVTLKEAVWMQDVPKDWYIRGVADFNKDGHADILWRNKVNGKNFIWYMNGITLSSNAEVTAVSPETGWDIFGVGNFH